jgi:hypothetical protein
VLPSMMATQELVVPKSMPMIFPMIFYSVDVKDRLDIWVSCWFSRGIQEHRKHRKYAECTEIFEGFLSVSSVGFLCFLCSSLL